MSTFVTLKSLYPCFVCRIRCVCNQSSNGYSLFSPFSAALIISAYVRFMQHSLHYLYEFLMVLFIPSVLWRCWLGGRKGIRPVKNWVLGCWRGCLEQDADLHMAQLFPLPLTVSCLSKIQIYFTFLVPAHPGSPGKGPLSEYVCMFSVFDQFHVHLTGGVCSGFGVLQGVFPPIFSIPYSGETIRQTQKRLIAAIYVAWISVTVPCLVGLSGWDFTHSVVWEAEYLLLALPDCPRTVYSMQTAEQGLCNGMVSICPVAAAEEQLDTVRSQATGCSSTGLQYSAHRQVQTVPCLQPRDAAEHRVFV